MDKDITQERVSNRANAKSVRTRGHYKFKLEDENEEKLLQDV